MMMLETKVARGAALLDQHKPDWYRCVNLDELRQSSISMCVLGQNYIDYKKGVMHLFPGVGAVQREVEATYYGFVSPGEYAEATELWKSEIEMRRARMLEVTVNPADVVSIPDPVVINVYHLADAKRIIKDALDNADTRVPGLTESGVLLSLIEALGVRSLIKVDN